MLPLTECVWEFRNNTLWDTYCPINLVNHQSYFLAACFFSVSVFFGNSVRNFLRMTWLTGSLSINQWTQSIDKAKITLLL